MTGDELSQKLRLGWRLVLRAPTAVSRMGVSGISEKFLDAWEAGGFRAVRERLGRYAQEAPVDHAIETDSCFATLQANVAHRPDGRDHVAWTHESLADHNASVRLIAFYLPQFHPIAENDAFWGRGFTEWTNVSKALPQFVGHYQPRLPGELGFYDLRIKDVQRRQIEIARQHGVYGFCYHHYWFAGRRVLETPFRQMLADPTLDLPFCVCWANENWTRRWDGGEREVLIAQQHSPADDIAFIEALAPAFNDKRYIRVNGKPLLVVYRPALLPDVKATATRWREHAHELGLGEIHLVSVQSFDVEDPRELGFDATIEFPPLKMATKEITREHAFFRSDYSGRLYDYKALVDRAAEPRTENYPFYRGVMPAWDNEPRNPGRGVAYVGSTPGLYGRWLRSVCNQSLENPVGERLVFINAWNEWGEGAYLEPDRRFGYAYLSETRRVMREFVAPDARVAARLAETIDQSSKRHEIAVVLHLFYEDLWEELAKRLALLPPFDLHVSLQPTVSEETVARILTAYPTATLYPFANRGRDILPFLQTLARIEPRRYLAVLKLHTKKSPHREDGLELRNRAWDSLIGSTERVTKLIEAFRAEPQLGLVTPDEVLSLRNPEYRRGNEEGLRHLLRRLGENPRPEFSFVPGSMFWFRGDAFSRLTALGLGDADFPAELGQIDGTTAHAVERIFSYVAGLEGYRVRTLSELFNEPAHVDVVHHSIDVVPIRRHR